MPPVELPVEPDELPVELVGLGVGFTVGLGEAEGLGETVGVGLAEGVVEPPPELLLITGIAVPVTSTES